MSKGLKMTWPTPHCAADLERLARAAPSAGECFGLPYDDGQRVPVAFYPRTAPEGDGGDVTVYVTRAPAMFYEVHCPALSVYLGTGSSGEELAHEIALGLAEGRLGLCSPLPVPEHEAHTEDGPANCPRCQMLRDLPLSTAEAIERELAIERERCTCPAWPGRPCRNPADGPDRECGNCRDAHGICGTTHGEAS